MAGSGPKNETHPAPGQSGRRKARVTNTAHMTARNLFSLFPLIRACLTAALPMPALLMPALLMAPLLMAPLLMAAITGVALIAAPVLPAAAQSAPPGAAGQPSFAAGQDVQRIAAIVNDAVISAYDLDQRLGLVLATAGVPPTRENIERIRPQILRALIDETLQIQEARKNKIEVTPEEVDEAIERLGQRNGMSMAQIEQFLKSANVDISTLRQQVYAELAWNELVRSRFGPRVTVTDSEVDTVLERIVAQAQRASYLVSEVLIPVENPEDEAEARRTAQELVQQLRAGGNIRAIASQFSQAPTAANGGDVGWVLDGQLGDELNTVLRQLEVGAVSDPIRTSAGYHILQLRDRRLGGDQQDPLDALVTLEVAIVPFNEEMDRARAERIAQGVRAALERPIACGQLETIVRRIDSEATVNRIEDRPIRGFPEAIRPALVRMTPNSWGQPQRTPQGLELVVMCSKRFVERELPSRDEIEAQLFSQELAMMSRRYLRDLRRNAVVEMR